MHPKTNRKAWMLATMIFTLTLVLAVALTAMAMKPPHMANALDYLKNARTQLQEAAHGQFGGHREKALRHVNAAIEEVHAGIQYVKQHHQGGQ
jgi:hypothetical protein